MAKELINNNSSRVENFIDSLEAQKSMLTTCTDLYKTLTTHFSSIQQTLTLKSQALDSKIEAFNVHVEKTLISLTQRENAIPELESSAVARIKEKKELAVSGMENSADMVNGEFLEMVGLYSRRMDVNRLLDYLLMKRRNSLQMKSEIVGKIVEETVDVLTLVLDGIDGFLKMKEDKVGLMDKRWACGLLIEGLFDYGCEYGVKGVRGVPVKVGDRAFGLLEKWKELTEREKGDGGDDGGGGGGGMGCSEAAMFLQAVIVFGLKERFEEEYLKNLLKENAKKKGMAKIALAMAFWEKMEDIIEEFVKVGKEIEAIYFAYDCGLTEQFPPLTLLKSYLRTSRTKATAVLKEGGYTAAATDEACTMELNSIKSILKCVRDHKLESEFPLDSLRKRVPQLRKSKAERRNAPPPGRPSNTRPVGESGGGGGGGGRSGRRGPPSSRPFKLRRHSIASPSISHRSPLAAAARYPRPLYDYPSPSVYQAPPATSYELLAYGGAHSYSQSPAALAEKFSLTAQDHVHTVAGSSGALYGGQTNYNAAVPPPSYPPYYP